MVLGSSFCHPMPLFVVTSCFRVYFRPPCMRRRRYANGIYSDTRLETFLLGRCPWGRRRRDLGDNRRLSWVRYIIGYLCWLQIFAAPWAIASTAAWAHRRRPQSITSSSNEPDPADRHRHPFLGYRFSRPGCCRVASKDLSHLLYVETE